MSLEDGTISNPPIKKVEMFVKPARRQMPIRLPEPVYNKLRNYAMIRNISMNHVISEIVAEFFDQNGL